MNNYLESFIAFLDAKNYAGKYFINKYHYSKDKSDSYHYRIDVRDGEKTIQSFLILTSAELKRTEKYPFYRAFKQNATKKDQVLPACFLVSKEDDGEWYAYNCNCPEQRMSSDDIFDYDKALKRFKKRWNSVSSVEMLRKVRVICWTSSAMFLALTVLDYILNLGLLNYTIPLVIILALVLIPIFLPHITSATLNKNGIDVSLE